jgi:hypothetical protein
VIFLDLSGDRLQIVLISQRQSREGKGCGAGGGSLDEGSSVHGQRG